MVGLVRRVDLMLASLVTNSSALMGVATFNVDDDERMTGVVADGVKASTAADDEQIAATTASEENCIVESLLFTADIVPTGNNELISGCDVLLVLRSAAKKDSKIFQKISHFRGDACFVIPHFEFIDLNSKADTLSNLRRRK